MKTAKLRNSVTGQRTTVWSLAFSPGGQTLASGSLDGKIVLWDVASGKSLQEVWSHQGAVTSLAFAPDAGTLASGGADATLNLWNTTLRAIPPLLTLVPGHGAVRSVAFSPDGRTLATSGEDGKARLWAFPALEWQRELGDYLGPATCVAFSPEGHRLALGGADRRITLWDTRDGRRLHELKGHVGVVTSLRFSPDGKRLASSAHDSEVRVWDLEDLRKSLKLKHLTASQCVDWSPDGRLLCAGTDAPEETESSHLAILWNAETGQEIARLKGHRAHLTLVRFSPDGKRLATGASDTQLHLWDVATRKVLGSMTTHWGVPDARFLPDGQTLAVAMHAGRFCLWDLSTFREAVQYEGHGPFTVAGLYGWGIYGVAVSPDGSVVASTDSRGLVKFWPTFRGTRDPTSAAASLTKRAAATGPVMPPPGAAPAPSGLVYSIAAQQSGALFATFSPDGKLLAAGGEDGTLVFLETEKGRVLRTVPAHKGAVLTGAFSPDGRRFATGGSDGDVKRWDVDSGRPIGSILGPFALIRTVAFTRDGENLVCGNDAGLFRRWETETGRELSKAHLSSMAWMALSPDGKLAATANWDWTAGVWNLEDLKQVAVLKGHVGAVISTAFSPDGRLLVSTSAGVGVDPKENVKLWDTESWTERAALEGHRGYVHCATFSPDGKTIATCGADLTIRLWNAADGKPLKELRGHTASIVFVRFSPDGHRLASAGLDGTVKVWTP
jgi:WD40 repeat protein